MQDRRVFARIRVRLPLRFLSLGRENECPAEVADISGKGIGFISKTKIQPFTSLEMWLDIPGQDEAFYVRGEVVWSSPMPDAIQHHVGVRLEKAELMGLAPLLKRQKR